MIVELFLAMLLAAMPAGDAWSIIGDAKQVELSDKGSVQMRCAQPATAGALSPKHPARGAAVLVEAQVSGAAPRAVTFAAIDAESGQTVGYWQNPVEVKAQTKIAAILPLETSTRDARLFVGTDEQPSAALVENVEWRPVRAGAKHRSTVWGVLVDDAHVAGQTVKVTGKSLEAISFRARQLNRTEGGPDLRLRVYEVKAKGGSPALDKPPLSEVIVPRHQFPAAEGDGERELTVALKAKAPASGTCYVEFAAAGPCSSQQAFLLFGGPDGYAGGSRFENGSPVKDWDVDFETYESN